MSVCVPYTYQTFGYSGISGSERHNQLQKERKKIEKEKWMLSLFPVKKIHERTLPLRKPTLITRHDTHSTASAIRKRHGQVDVSSVRGNNNVTRTERDKVCSVVSKMPEGLLPRIPRPEMIGVCSASVLKSVAKEGNELTEPKPEKICSSLRKSFNKGYNVAGFSQLPERLLPPKPDREVRSTVRGSKSVAVVRNSKSLDRELVKANLQYTNLFLNWVPPSPQIVLGSDDQDWLFLNQNPDTQTAKKLKPNNNVSCGSKASLWPRAQFLPEGDIYALPYTVPF